jgi:hypothetical protein
MSDDNLYFFQVLRKTNRRKWCPKEKSKEFTIIKTSFLLATSHITCFVGVTELNYVVLMCCRCGEILPHPCEQSEVFL